jgi:hypothetical protein
MTLRVPEAYLSVWVVTRFAMEESSQTRLTAIVFLVALTVGLALPLVLLTVAMDQAWLRFVLMAAMGALGLFLRRTFVIGALGFVIGLIGTLIMTVPDFIWKRGWRYCGSRVGSPLPQDEFARSTTLLSVRRGLNVVELRVRAALAHELVVRTDFDQTRAVEDNDEVGHADG